MAIFVKRSTVRRTLAEVLGVLTTQDGYPATQAGQFIALDDKAALAEIQAAISFLRPHGLMRARDYTALIARLQQARVVQRRGGFKGDPAAASAWVDRAKRVAAYPFLDLATRVGPLEPGSAWVSQGTHERIVDVVRTSWTHGRNGRVGAVL